MFENIGFLFSWHLKSIYDFFFTVIHLSVFLIIIIITIIITIVIILHLYSAEIIKYSKALYNVRLRLQLKSKKNVFKKIMQFKKRIIRLWHAIRQYKKIILNFDLKLVRVGLSLISRGSLLKRSRVCKGTITKCPEFGSGNSKEAIVLGAQAIRCVSLYV